MLSPKDILRGSVLMLSVVALVGCSNNDSSTHSLGEFNAKTVGAICTVVDSNGAQLSATTESNGMVSTNGNLATGLVTMTCTGGTYKDEATGVIIDAPTVRVATNYTGGGLTLIATPLSEIAYALASAAGDTANMATYNAKVATAFGIRDVDIVGTTPQDLNDGTVDTSAAGKLGLILAAISQMGDTAGTDAATTIDNLKADIDSSTDDDALPAGTLSTAINNLQDSGVGASENAKGSEAAETAIVGGSSAPDLANQSAQTYTQNSAISALSFVNSGGQALTDCTADSLPAGLSVAVSSDSSTCEITGTPTATQSATTHTITATNATGSDTAIVNITVTASLALPDLADQSAQTYTQNSAISTLSFVNSGGQALTGCTADSLPAGLSVAVSSDSSTCEITGTPTATQSATTHTITATNATGSDTAIVNITVTASLALPDLADQSAQTYTQNSAISTLSFVNSGGQALTGCTADSLPTGLSVAVSSDRSTCEITGTPTATQSATTHTMTATNATGSDTATVDITVTAAPLALPDLANQSAQTYTQNSAISTLSFVNSGGQALTGCTADSLPTGLSVAVSSDNSTCDITGTPTATQSAATHTITATNATGDDETPATVSITVNAANVTMSAPVAVAGTNNKVALALSGNANGTFAPGDFAIASSNAKTAPTISSVEFTDGTNSLALVMNRNVASASAGSSLEGFTVAFTKSSSTVNVNNMTATAITNNSDNQNCSDCVLDSNGCPF